MLLGQLSHLHPGLAGHHYQDHAVEGGGEGGGDGDTGGDHFPEIHLGQS